jgi:REP element-mobilizing transposase RayT
MAGQYNPEIHRRRSIRLRDHDYSRAGSYFVTICTKNREFLFGEIKDRKMKLNDPGKMMMYWWEKMNDKFPTVKTDEYVVMPNHFHGIIVIVESLLL